MKKLFYSVFLLLIGTSLKSSGQLSSINGYSVSVEDTVRVLLVFAELNCTNPPCSGANDSLYCLDDNGYWFPNQLPPDASNWFDPQLNGQLPGKYLTSYYYEASLGHYYLLGDYLPYVVSVPCYVATSANNYGLNQVIDSLNAKTAAIVTANGLSLNRFDLWNHEDKSGVIKSQTSNDTLECIVVIWRNNKNFGCGGGLGVQTFYPNGRHLQNKYAKICGNWGDCNGNTYFTFTAEYLHAIFGGNNWHSGSGASNYTLPFIQGSYSITGQSSSASNKVCGWDRFHLGWYHPDNTLDTITALSKTGSLKVADLKQPATAADDTFVLRDFYTTGDAIRIKLPYINWTTNGDVKNQYLWIENRQKISEFDINQFGDSGCKEPLSKGLYMQIQVGKDFKFGSNSNVFPGYGSSDWQKPNSLSSWLFPMTAEGNFDYHFGEPPVTSQWYTDCGWGNTSEPINKADPLMQPNPFTGLNDLYIYWNTNGDSLLYQGDSVQPWLNEKINGSIVWNALQKGDSTDAFKLSGKKKISISTNPAPIPVFTYRTKDLQSNGTLANYDPNEVKVSWENRVIHLNGLSIEILSETANNNLPHCLDGSVPKDEKVRIRWNDYDITDHVRWCADSIVLHESIGGANSYSLNIKSGYSITLDRSKSPNRHKAVEQINGEWYYNTKTKMTCDQNSYLHIENNADLYIKNGSTLELKSGSKLELANGARLWVSTGGKLKVDDGAELVIHRDAFLQVEEDGELEIDNVTSNKGLKFESTNGTITAELKIYGKLTYNNAAMAHSGYGFFHFMSNSVLNLIGSASVGLAASYSNVKMLELDGAQIAISGHNVSMSYGLVNVHANSWFKASDGSVSLYNVNVDGVDANTTGSEGIIIESPSSMSITTCAFSDLDIGIDLHSVTYPVLGTISYATFTNCKTGIKCTDYVNVYISHSTLSNSNSTGSIGINAIGWNAPRQIGNNHITIDNTSIEYYETGVQLTHVPSFYMTNSSRIYDGSAGLSSSDSKVFMRNGAAIEQPGQYGINMTGTWNSATSNWSSMLSMGDQGCAAIYNVVGVTALKATNTLLNIDAIFNDQNGDHDNKYDHLWFEFDEASPPQYTLDICYSDPNHTITNIWARQNTWVLPNHSNQAPSSTTYKLRNNATCLPQSYPACTLNVTPISGCVPTTFDCTPCVEMRLSNAKEGDDSITVDDIINQSFGDAYRDFIDTDYYKTRNEFTPISILDLVYDTIEQHWLMITVSGVQLVVEDSSAQRIMTAKILKELLDTSNERLSAPDMFAAYYAELLSPHQSSLNQKQEHNLVLYPNPAEGKVNIYFKHPTNSKEVILMNLLGKELKAINILDRGEMNIADLPQGVYIIKAVNPEDQSFETEYLAVE